MAKEQKIRQEERGAGGTSAVEKACRILKAMTDPRNCRLTDIASYCGMEKSTAMRVLDELIKENMVVRDPASKRYLLGPELARIGAGAREPFDWKSLARPSLMRLAGEFGDTAILSVLSGVETVCADVQAGNYPIQANFQQIGSRRTLGVGSGGVVLLAAMSDPERQAALSQIPPRLSGFPAITMTLLEERVGAARDSGYALLVDAVVPHMGGVAVAILDEQGGPLAALSIAALSERIVTREKALSTALKREAKVIELNLARLGANRRAGTGNAVA